MGLRAWAAKAPVGIYSNLMVYSDRIKRGREEHPLDEVTATLERGADLQKRITATRVLAVGMFALAAKKKSGGEWWLVIEGPGFVWTDEVSAKDQGRARVFVGKVNGAVAALR